MFQETRKADPVIQTTGEESSKVDAWPRISATNQTFISSTVSCFEDRVDTAAENILMKDKNIKTPISGTDFKHSSSSYKPSSEEKSSDSFKLSDSGNSILN